MTVFLIFAGITCFICAHFNPALLLLRTVTTGGDLGSHFYPAKYLREFLLPQLKLHGWSQAHYCGYPIFLFYFPSSFLLIVFLSFLVPLEIAFKAVTASTVFLLPPAAYYLLRKLRYEFPVPVTGALFSAVFLFNGGNSMWGGNVFSTLAGEFSYQMGFAFLCFFLGSLYKNILKFEGEIKTAFLLALVGLTHGYALVFAFAMAPFFILTAPPGLLLRRTVYLIKIYALGISLMAFWFLPMLVNQPWTIPFKFAWSFTAREMLPLPMAAFFALSGAAFLAKICGFNFAGRPLLNERFIFLAYGSFSGILLFLLGFRLGVVDIRFIPFTQFFLLLMSAVAFWGFCTFLKEQGFWTLLLGALVLTAVGFANPAPADWFQWNYSGFETKPGWKDFQQINRTLEGSFADPRVAVEPSETYESFGTPRAFESLPLFSGRQTLEGLYMQSSISSPFVFYQQAEMSPFAPCPYTDYHYPRFDFAKALAHLRLFNVRDLVVASERAKEACKNSGELRHKKTFGKIEIYELLNNGNRYVSPLPFQPVIAGPSWKRDGYEWFRRADWLDVPLIFNAEPEDRRTVLAQAPAFQDFDHVPKIPIAEPPQIRETIQDEKIQFTVSKPGVPVLIRISYHPNWRVEGAKKIFFAAPSFMIVYPERQTVELTFRRSAADFAGLGITAAAILLAIAARIRRRASAERTWKADLLLRAWHRQIVWTLAGLIVSVFAGGVWLYMKTPGIVYNRAMRLYDQHRYLDARRAFEEFSSRYPHFSLGDESLFFHAMSAYLAGHYETAAADYRHFAEIFFDSAYLPEALYHWGLSCKALGKPGEMKEIFDRLNREFPDSSWSSHARKVLSEGGTAP